MFGLSFDQLPHYIYSNHRQFLAGEHHMERTFDEDVLILMRKGVLRFSEDGAPVELHAGQYYLQQKGKCQSGPLESDAPNYFFIHFRGTFKEGARLPLRGTFKSAAIRPIVEALEALGNAAPRLEYERLFYALLSELSKQQYDETLAESILSYLIRNYSKPISLDDLCNTLFLTANQVIYAFKAAYGKTPHRYLMDYRLEKAADLLVSTERPSSTIAYDIGFQEYSVFYRAFFSKYGTSPTEFREKHGGFFFLPPPNERPEENQD